MNAPPSPVAATGTGVRGFIRSHTLLSFFLLANGLSWLAWVPYILSQSGLGITGLVIPEVLGTDQIIGVLPGAYLGPVTAAFIVTALSEGRAGLRHWAGRLLRWRVSWRWYAGILTAVPAIVVLATLLMPGALADIRVPGVEVLLMYPVMLVIQFFTTAVAEEPGWRDFALPRLQRRHGALVGTVVLGLLWGAWHLPLFVTTWGGWPDVAWWQPVEFVIACVPLSLAMTWVFNRTNESLPMVMILHASINTVFSLVWPAMFPNLTHHDSGHVVLIASTAAALVLVAVTRGRLGLGVRQSSTVIEPEPTAAVAPEPQVSR